MSENEKNLPSDPDDYKSLLAKFRAFLDSLPAEERAQFQRIFSHTSISMSSHSGPLPTPEAFAEYERICPGAARDIVNLAKDEATAFLILNKKQLNNERFRIICATIGAGLAASVPLVSIIVGNDIVAYVTGAFLIGSITWLLRKIWPKD